MKRGDVFQGSYLRKEDVAQPAVLTIDAVRMETIKGDGGSEDKAVLYFAGDRFKPLVLNAGNWDTLESAYGEESDGWIGQRVEVYVDPGVMYAGKRVGGLRLRIPAQAARATAQPASGAAAQALAAAGQRPGSGLLDWNAAIAAYEAAGGTKAELVDALKYHGLTAYNAARDTALVRELIGNCQQQSATPPPSGEEIPF